MSEMRHKQKNQKSTKSIHKSSSQSRHTQNILTTFSDCGLIQIENHSTIAIIGLAKYLEIDWKTTARRKATLGKEITFLYKQGVGKLQNGKKLHGHTDFR